jgi:pyridoxal phosphate enzyme (YggS family)
VTTVDPAEVSARLDRVRARIDGAAGGRAVGIVAVTKGFGADAVRAALGLGLAMVGENYAQELVAKAAALDAEPVDGTTPSWHFLGRLQRNKVRQVAPLVSVWESMDRVELLDEVARRAPGATVLVQANLSGEPQKGGAPLDGVPDLVAHARDLGLAVDGLMGVGPAGDPDGTRAGFRALVALADELGLEQRSIGMSDDLEVAVQEGATLVRVGRDLFGPRPPKPSTAG